MKFQLLIKTNMLKNEDFSWIKLSDVVFIMLLDVKMPTIVGIFNIYEYDKFHAQLSWSWTKFYNLKAWLKAWTIN